MNKINLLRLPDMEVSLAKIVPQLSNLTLAVVILIVCQIVQIALFLYILMRK